MSLRWAWLAVGHLALAVGVVGIVLPLLPTTPFLLVAAYCYSRGSQRFETWLLTHPRLGPMVADWRAHGVIRLRAKVVAAAMIVLSIAYVATQDRIPLGGKAAMAAVTLSALTFILTRPSRPG